MFKSISLFQYSVVWLGDYSRQSHLVKHGEEFTPETIDIPEYDLLVMDADGVGGHHSVLFTVIEILGDNHFIDPGAYTFPVDQDLRNDPQDLASGFLDSTRQCRQFK